MEIWRGGDSVRSVSGFELSNIDGVGKNNAGQALMNVNSSIPEFPRNEVVWQIFGEGVGSVIEDFSCALQSRILLHGRLYITPGHLLFYSNIFGFEKIVRIPFTHVKNISRESTALIIPNAIAITTSKSTYVFRSFWDREEAIFIIKNAHRMSQGLQPYTFEKFREMSLEKELRDQEKKRENKDGLNSSYSSEHKSNVSMTNSDYDKVWVPISGMTEDSEEDAEMNGIISEDENLTNLTENVSSSFNLQLLENLDPKKQIQNDSKSDSLIKAPESDDDLKLFLSSLNALERRSEGSKTVSLEATINSGETEPSRALNKYFSTFLSDNATHGLTAFHISQGDSEVATTHWEEDGDGWKTRELRYLHPYSGPMGGASVCRTVKAQRCRIFGRFGLILHTTTYLEDVPMSDYFQLEDRCTVTSVGEATQVLAANVVMEIKFIKSTMVKGIIENRSLGESKEVWVKFFEMAKKTFEAQNGLSSVAPSSFIEPEPTPESKAGKNDGSNLSEKLLSRRNSSSNSLHRSNDSLRKVKWRKNGSSLRSFLVVMFILFPWFILGYICMLELAKYIRLQAEVKGFMEGLGLALNEGNGEDANCPMKLMKEKVVEKVSEMYLNEHFLARQIVPRR